jgi:hypothetical protein
MSRNTILPEALAEERVGCWTFHAEIPQEYQGHAFTVEAVLVGDHWHVWVHSGRHVPTRSTGARVNRGFAGKLILRRGEWEVLRSALDEGSEAVAIYEVERPTPGMAKRYLGVPGEGD